MLINENLIIINRSEWYQSSIPNLDLINFQGLRFISTTPERERERERARWRGWRCCSAWPGPWPSSTARWSPSWSPSGLAPGLLWPPPPPPVTPRYSLLVLDLLCSSSLALCPSLTHCIRSLPIYLFLASLRLCVEREYWAFARLLRICPGFVLHCCKYMHFFYVWSFCYVFEFFPIDLEAEWCEYGILMIPAVRIWCSFVGFFIFYLF